MKKYFVLFLLFCFQTIISAQENINYAESVNKFAFDLYGEIIKETNDNIIFSPLSLSVAIAQLYIGSKGEAREEIADVMYFEGDNDEFLTEYGAFIDSIGTNRKEKDLILSIANIFAIRHDIQVKKEYTSFLKQYFDSELYSIKSKGEFADYVNGWVKEKTYGKIAELIDPKGKYAEKFMLLNAIYFKDSWKNKFDEDKTKKDKFFLCSGKEIEKEFMSKIDNILYGSFQDYQSVVLPYDAGQQFMLILLPGAVDGIKILESKLSDIKISGIINNSRKTKLGIVMPKFSSELKPLKIRNMLMESGARKVFAGTGDMTNIFTNILNPGPLDIMHKAKIEVNEEGAEAAAATMIMDFYYSENKTLSTIKLDHPFLYFIIDGDTNTILFMGRCMNPVQ